MTADSSMDPAAIVPGHKPRNRRPWQKIHPLGEQGLAGKHCSFREAGSRKAGQTLSARSSRHHPEIASNPLHAKGFRNPAPQKPDSLAAKSRCDFIPVHWR
jgi:hypothetical protein